MSLADRVAPQQRSPEVDVVIAVHSATRPIARAVASVIDHNTADVRVIVVAHNIDPDIIRGNLGDYAGHDRVWLTDLQDGVRSPAGPMNHGFAVATARFVALLGSDDEFAPGAIDSWLATQQVANAQAVLARITLPDGRTDPYPPVRRGRRVQRLHPIRDRLAYRSAPLGLIERASFGELRLTEGLESGEDLVYGLTVHFTASRLAYDLSNRGYVIHADSTDRVTFAPRPLERDFAFWQVLSAEPWFAALSRSARRSIVLKIIRIHVFDAIASRVQTPEALAANRAGLTALVHELASAAPGVTGLLSQADTTVLRLLRRPDSTPEQLLNAINDRHRISSLATMLPANPLLALASQAPFRTLWSGFRLQNGALLSASASDYARP